MVLSNNVQTTNNISYLNRKGKLFKAEPFVCASPRTKTIKCLKQERCFSNQILLKP